MLVSTWRYKWPHRRAACLCAFALALTHFACFSEDNFWDVLEQQGRALDIMSINAVSGRIIMVGARYADAPWQARGESDASAFLPSVMRKQLYIMSIAANEQVIWQHSYPALPEVSEIFSTAATGNQHLCVLYGEQPGDDVISDPVLLQVDAQGKILWAKRNLITKSSMDSSATDSLEQIANLDTLRVTGSPDNGCVLVYVTRQISGNNEKFRLHVAQHSPDGNEKWQQSVDTQLYGKLFLVHSQGANRYVIVQTNQSRDAAIQAMMLGEPFRPKTALLGVDYSGNVIFQTVEPAELSRLWVNSVLEGESDSILIAGRIKTAWAGHVNKDGKIRNFTDVFDDEFTAGAVVSTSGYLLSRGDHVTLTTGKLEVLTDQPTRNVVTRQYLNQYLMARLPDDLPVQQIIPVNNNEYLLMYSLGSRLVKIRLDKMAK